jgi:hypothetical protein
MYCSLFYCIAPLHVNVWCLESELFEEFAAAKDFQDFEQQQEFTEGK